jgi:hypothetical protein
MIASTESSSCAASRASPYRSGSASPRTSIGLPTLAAAGSFSRSALAVATFNSATRIPEFSTASAAMMPGPPAFVMIATRLPLGSGCISNAVALSKSDSKVAARRMPERRNAAP